MLDKGGYDWNDYVRQEGTLRPRMCKFRRGGALFGTEISKTFHYDRAAQSLELNLEWAWTKIGDLEDLSELRSSIPTAQIEGIDSLG